MMAGLIMLAAAFSFGQANNPSQKSHAKTDPQKAQSAGTSRGQQVFNQNCARCHNAPEGFSPNISGTITRHMRVRAGLSDEDYKALLNFFNP
jgi:cytochrome c5